MTPPRDGEDWSDRDSADSDLLSPAESLDEDEVGEELDRGYSPAERPLGSTTWGVTGREQSSHESLTRRLARELPDITDRMDGDGIGDANDTDGEPLDDEVGDARAGRLVLGDADAIDSRSDYWARDVGTDDRAASAEEAAVHLIPERDE